MAQSGLAEEKSEDTNAVGDPRMGRQLFYTSCTIYCMTPSEGLPTPPTQSIVYEDNYLYVCQALQPITRGHLIVVWKRNARDIQDIFLQAI